MYIFLLSRYWDFVPRLEGYSLTILEYFLKIFPKASTLYKVYSETNLQVSTVYKIGYSLARRRYILPTSNGKFVATAKGAIGLILAGRLEALSYLKKIWKIEADDEDLLAYLVVLGVALKKLGFDLTSAYICPPHGGPFYISEFINNGVYISLERTLNLPREIVKKSWQVYRKLAQFKYHTVHYNKRSKQISCNNMNNIITEE